MMKQSGLVIRVASLLLLRDKLFGKGLYGVSGL